MKTLTLAAHDFQLSLNQEIGASVTSLNWRGHKILRDSASPLSSPLDASAFPMVPYSGRLKQGKFMFKGHSVKLEPNMPPEPHSIHGLCWQAPWEVSKTTGTSITLVRNHNGEKWPWQYQSEQVFKFTASSLIVSLKLTNLSDHEMPAGIGWHPYFHRQDAIISANTNAIWQGPPGEISSELVEIAEDQPPRARRAADDLSFDNAFSWPTREAQIDWPSSGISMRMSATEPLSHLIIYAPPGADFICIEPASHVPDALNSELASEVSGLRSLQPGETLEGQITLELDQAL